MALGWLMVLQGVPWTEVVKNAPKVADGAKKLWNTIANKKPLAPEVPSATEKPALSPEAQAIATLQRQVAALEIAMADQHTQLLASSELIRTLAEQNTQLIQSIEANRVRVHRLLGATVVLGLVAVATLILLLVR